MIQKLLGVKDFPQQLSSSPLGFIHQIHHQKLGILVIEELQEVSFFGYERMPGDAGHRHDRNRFVAGVLEISFLFHIYTLTYSYQIVKGYFSTFFILSTYKKQYE